MKRSRSRPSATLETGYRTQWALWPSSDHRRFSSRQGVTWIALVKREEQADCLSGNAARLRQNGLVKRIGFMQFYRTVQPSAVNPNSA
jgi:hypothetical protein